MTKTTCQKRAEGLVWERKCTVTSLNLLIRESTGISMLEYFALCLGPRRRIPWERTQDETREKPLVNT